MAFTSAPVPGISQIVSITDWESFFAGVSVSGVVAGAQNQLAPSLDTSGRNIVINTGTAMVRGFSFQNTSSTSTPIPSASGQNRIDRLVLRLNRAASTVPTFIVPTVITGTPAASPVEPSVTQTTTGLWDLPVCSWTSASSGALTGLRDERAPVANVLSGLSAARPAMTGPGLLIETDTGGLALWNGSSWSYLVAPADTWHNLTPLWNSFSLGTGATGPDTPQYRLMPDGSLALRGTVLTPGSGNVLGVAWGNVPGPYQPTGRQAQAVVANVDGFAWASLSVGPGGNLYFSGGTIGNRYNVVIDCFIPIQQ